MPVVTIALNGKFDGRKCNVYPEWNNWILTLRQKTCGFKRGNHSDLDTANSGHGFLRQEGVAALRTRSESGYQRRLHLANFTAHLTCHFDLWLIQRMVFAYLSQCFVASRTKARTTCSFVVRSYRKCFTALRTYLVNSRQSSRSRLVGSIGTLSGAVSAIKITAFLEVCISTCDASPCMVLDSSAEIATLSAAKSLLAIRGREIAAASPARSGRLFLFCLPLAFINVATGANDTAIAAVIIFIGIVTKNLTAMFAILDKHRLATFLLNTKSRLSMTVEGRQTSTTVAQTGLE